MPEQTDQEIGNDQIFCSHCGTDNAKGSYACTRCGERLLEIKTDTPTPLGLVSCPRCGGANNARAVYCWVCGTGMNDAVRISPTPQSQPEKTPRAYRPDLNPISVPASEPTDERTDLRGPIAGAQAGPSAGTGIGSGPLPDSVAGPDENAPNTSGTKGAVVPAEVKGWNWAAFLVTPIWGLFSGVPLAVLMFATYLPFLPNWFRVGALMAGSLYLGFRGNELAWRGKKWRSVKHFKAVQQRWLVWSIGLNLLGLVLVLLFSGSPAEG